MIIICNLIQVIQLIVFNSVKVGITTCMYIVYLGDNAQGTWKEIRIITNWS